VYCKVFGEFLFGSKFFSFSNLNYFRWLGREGHSNERKQPLNCLDFNRIRIKKAKNEKKITFQVSKICEQINCLNWYSSLKADQNPIELKKRFTPNFVNNIQD
jgi:hypothetical protein